MPTPKGTPPPESAAAAQDAPAEPGASPSPEADPTPAGLLPPGVYEYVAPFATVYHLPLTAHPADPGQSAREEHPAVPAAPATVFDWQFGCPDDGRWAPSRKKPNQLPDNAPADLPKE